MKSARGGGHARCGRIMNQYDPNEQAPLPLAPPVPSQ
jgi:hypothetical protein